jgi:16S rRNA (guanine966-N2)-methyltransferase
MKLRIISGTLGSRQFDTPHGFATHPMGERVRGALFNSLGSVAGKRVLDAFAGSGALSFEAISRGASSALAIERDRSAARVLEQNASGLGVGERVRIVKATALQWSQQEPNTLFDLIFCDPPYNNLQLITISHLAKHLADDGLLVLSHPSNMPAPELANLRLVDTSKKPYSGASLAYYRKA